MKFNAEFDENTFEIDLNTEDSTFVIGDEPRNYEFEEDNGRFYLRRGTKLHKIDNVKFDGSLIEFSMDGNWYKVSVKDEEELLLDRLGFKTGSSGTEGALTSPMPGKILDIMVSVGDEVEKGQRVAILEAMKMENELKAPIGGVIKSVDVEVGQSVEKKTPILEIE